MYDVVNKLAHSLLQKNTLQEFSAEELKKLASRYPYFSPAHLLLSAKLKEENNPDFDELVQTTALYINNPLWLQLILFNNNADISSSEIREPSVAATPVFEDFKNDEIVVENPRHFFTTPEIKEKEIPVPEVKTEIRKVAESPLVFEPYHTVDYFASQGIRQKLDDNPKDRFSQQLKSFTEWLKTIRQMPPQQIAAKTDSGSEEKVVELATHSIEDRNVVTEAMAEVWIKQDEPAKAIEIYSKLSLLNPSKSSYFASLIEKLK
jgi:hypothetical protein